MLTGDIRATSQEFASEPPEKELKKVVTVTFAKNHLRLQMPWCSRGEFQEKL